MILVCIGLLYCDQATISATHTLIIHNVNMASNIFLLYITITATHISYKHLDYHPHWYSSITSFNSSSVIVAQYNPPAIHIHQLPHGETVRSIGHQELGLQETDYLHGVHYTGILLHLAVGGHSKRTSLHTFKV